MKKFLTVLLALSVVFTYSFSAVGTAFAATPSASEKESLEAFTEVVEAAKKAIAYDGYKYMKTDDDANGVISESVVNAGIDDLVIKYTEKLSKVTSNWDNEWSTVNTVEGFHDELFEGPTRTYAKLLKAQFDIDKAAAEAALDPELKGYTDAAKQAIKNQISTLKTSKFDVAVNDFSAPTATVEDKANAIKSLRTDVVKAMADFLKTQPTVADSTKKVADAKKAAVKTLGTMSDAFIDAVGAATATNATEIAQQKTVINDVAKMVNFFEDQIEAAAADENAVTKINDVENVIKITFATTTAASIFNAEFYNDLAILDNVDLLKNYAKELADAKKAERKADGTLKYAAKDVEKAYNDVLEAISVAAYADIKSSSNTLVKSLVDSTMNRVIEQEYPLQSYKEQQILYITGEVNGVNNDTTFAASNWSGERKAKVIAIQIKAEEDILLADDVADVDAVVKKAVADMGAILTTAEINALKSTTDARIAALGYSDAFGKYFDAVVGTKGYSVKTKLDAVENAKQVLRDAVVAAEDAELTKAEIDKIVKENYDKAIAALVNVKSDAERAEAAKAVDALIAALPKTIEIANKDAVLAAQNAYEDYLGLPGANKIDVKNRLALSGALSDLIYLEATAVKNQIRALPATVTVNDAEAIEAARAALDALENTYGDYTEYAGPANIAKLEAAEAALEAARVKDAADKVAALGANPTKEAVEAARAAYDVLSIRSKLKFNEELYADLLNAEKKLAVSVETLKIVASSKAVKGKITIKWKVKGDASVADGFQVYKSKKSQKGYKFMGKTKKQYMDNKKGLKKGTRYFYKVRAYKVVDGKKLYSDWSNKANRIAK
ncbi:hypothetical protein ACDL92_01185 [Ihubacter sp. mB4P-1]|uniref:hypothetical protein n=1 Tax=Ihubacter sp. mB4P-1 TaxID=3242370 RepID=UPI003C7DDC76